MGIVVCLGCACVCVRACVHACVCVDRQQACWCPLFRNPVFLVEKVVTEPAFCPDLEAGCGAACQTITAETVHGWLGSLIILQASLAHHPLYINLDRGRFTSTDALGWISHFSFFSFSKYLKK